MDAFFQFTKLSTFQCIPISLFLCFLLLLLCISKFPFYIQRHYRKAFNSSHNVLCIWILKEEMETFFAAAFTPPAKEGAQEKKEKEKKFLLLYCSFDMILIKEFPVLELNYGKIIQNQIMNLKRTLFCCCFHSTSKRRTTGEEGKEKKGYFFFTAVLI